MARKLIEVAPFLPLDAISAASKADKDKKTGTIKNVHKWFAPMPAPAIRALIFAALVDAPAEEDERRRLMRLVERLAPPDGNAPDAATLEEAAAAIRASSGGNPPTVFDPFCGGGSTLIEAQRLGLKAMGSDLNPVPVLITRTLTELVPAVAGRPPLIGDPAQLGAWASGPYAGLLADVRYYAERVRASVWELVGDKYPLSPDGDTIVAWLWSWTATCPNPACGSTMPLVSSTWLSKRKGQERWLRPVPLAGGVRFEIGQGAGPPPASSKVGRGAKFTCLVCGQVANEGAIKAEGQTRGLGQQLLAIVTDSEGGKNYQAVKGVESEPASNRSRGELLGDLAVDPRNLWCREYGLETFESLFTPRQLSTLIGFSDAIAEVADWVEADGGAKDYSRAIASILGLALGKLAQSNSTQVRWFIDPRNGSAKATPAFGRQALPMVWDFVEVNPFGGSAGDWSGQIDSVARGIQALPTGVSPSIVRQADARGAPSPLSVGSVVVTDPPYFDQIGYADLSDYFYVWHRRALRKVHPDLYGTIVTPKDDELIASPYRHGGDKHRAAAWFVEGFTRVFETLRRTASEDHPLLIVYAHRQEERSAVGSASTGWDAMLEAVIAAGLTVEGTLPVRGTHSSRQIGLGTNALASYIVLVCRPRPDSLNPATLADFRAVLRERVPKPLEALLATGESIVDIRQAAIGPGMEIFCRFGAVYDGSDAIPVRRALSIINEELGRLLDEQLGTVDDETRWAAQWYTDNGYEAAEYDQARKLAAVFGLGVDGLNEAGIVESGRGRVRLLRRTELPATWDPRDDSRVPAWEACQHLVRRLGEGEEAAARLLAALGPRAAGLRELAQYLANVAIEKGWSEEGIAYDDVVTSWPRVEQLAAGMGDLVDVGRQLSL